jgi:hypothetical protein
MTGVMIFALKHWRYLAGAAVLALTGLMVHAYGRSRYNAGSASVQAKWDAARAEQAQIAASAAAADTTAGQQASNSYQGVIINEKERIRVVRETVIRTVTGPCLGPDSVRVVNQAIGGISAASAAR